MYRLTRLPGLSSLFFVRLTRPVLVHGPHEPGEVLLRGRHAERAHDVAELVGTDGAVAVLVEDGERLADLLDALLVQADLHRLGEQEATDRKS